MTDTQKAELADHFEKQFPEDTSFKSEEQKENAEFLGKLAGDPTMTMQEMKLAIRNLRDSQKKEFKTVPAEQEPTAKVKKENVKKEKEAAGDESK
jgi:hypothetical protein